MSVQSKYLNDTCNCENNLSINRDLNVVFQIAPHIKLKFKRKRKSLLAALNCFIFVHQVVARRIKTTWRQLIKLQVSTGATSWPGQVQCHVTALLFSWYVLHIKKKRCIRVSLDQLPCIKLCCSLAKSV